MLQKRKGPAKAGQSFGATAGNRQPHNTTKTPIFVGSKVIGHVSGDTFYKTISGSRHILRKPRAIAFDISTLHDAEAAGARKVHITDADTGKTYETALSTVWAKGWEFNRGFGKQWGVPIGEWNRDNHGRQLSLLGWAA